MIKLKRCLIFCLLSTLFALLSPSGVWAGTEEAEAREMLFEQMDALGLEDVDKETNAGFSFKSLVEKAVLGELDLSPQGIYQKLVAMLLSEIKQNGALMGHLLIISVLAALLKNLSESFQTKAVGELGFYVCYTVLVIVLFSAFGTAVSLTEGLIVSMAQFMRACIPLVLSLIVMSGTAGASLMFSPTLYMSVNVMTLVVETMLAPLVILGASVEIINYLTEKSMLSGMGELIRKGCLWGLKGIALAFVAVLTLQKLTSPILNNVATKSAKAALGVVPVVGSVLDGAWDMVYMWAGAAKSGVLAAFIIAVVVMCAAPVVKLLVLVFIFKLTSAVIQPITDERIVKCLDGIGSYSLLLLGLLATVAAMFIVSVVILLSF